jgi:PAS domain S-box-containing protein
MKHLYNKKKNVYPSLLVKIVVYLILTVLAPLIIISYFSFTGFKFYYFLILAVIYSSMIFFTVCVFYKSILSPIKMITNRFRNIQPSASAKQLKIENKYRGEIGELVHWFNIIVESILESNKSEIALKESQERFQALHNASFGGIAIHDKGVILECNKGLSTITGFSYEELIGMNGLLLISDETRDKVINNINIGYEKSYEAEGIRKNGEKYPIRLEARVIPYKNKNVRVVEFRDISETKRVAEEKESLENQLRQAQKMEAVGRLAGGVAHDYNNMLSVIIGHTEMALEQTHPSMSVHADLEEIMSAAKRSANLTRQLLAFARKQAVVPKIFDINKTVDEMINMLKRLIGEDIELIWKKTNQFYPIKIDPSQFDQILANLCLNARDAIDGVGKIIIETQKISVNENFCEIHAEATPGTYICLMVSDNGIGMDKITLSNIFEPFFTTKSIGKGTGLGLATVHGIVKQNNGFIIVSSEQGIGTSFQIYFPYKLQKETAQISQKLGIDCLGGQETILLVEDEPGILKILKKMLFHLGYNVLSANSPGVAMDIAKKHQDLIHLLITDVIMPEMSGRDLAENIVLLNPDVKCLFMSGYTADVIAHHGVLDSHISFIQKPFSHEELAVKIREVMDN